MVWPSDNDSHGVDRAGLVDLLVGGEMQGILGQFPELRQLHFTLVDNDSKYDAGWWSSEMIRRLPDSCRAAVSVDVVLWPRGASCGSVRSVAMIAYLCHAILRATPVAYAGGDRGN